MTKELLQQALEALKNSCDFIFKDVTKSHLRHQAIAGLEAAISQPTPAEYALGYCEGFEDACKPAQPTSPEQEEPVEYQYQGSDGVWKQFMNDAHRINTVIDGRSKVRAMYTTPQKAAIAQPAPHSFAKLYTENADRIEIERLKTVIESMQPVQPAYDTRQFSNLTNQAHGFAQPPTPKATP